MPFCVMAIRRPNPCRNCRRNFRILCVVRKNPVPLFPGSPFSQKTLSMFMTSRYQELPTLIRPTDMVLSVLTRADSI